MLNQLFAKKEAVVLPVHLKQGTKEFHVLELLKLMLEDELLSVDLNKVLVVEMTFMNKTYSLSGSRVHPWDKEGWIYSYHSFAHGETNYIVYNLASNRMQYTYASDRMALKALMTA